MKGADVKDETEPDPKKGSPKKVKVQGFCYLNIAKLLKVPTLECTSNPCIFDHFNDDLKRVSFKEAILIMTKVKDPDRKKLVLKAMNKSKGLFK